MQDVKMTQNNGGQQMPMDQQAQPGTPIDDVISTVDEFIANPKTITAQALAQLKMDLEDLKTILDGEQAPVAAPSPGPSAGGLAGMIGAR